MDEKVFIAYSERGRGSRSRLDAVLGELGQRAVVKNVLWSLDPRV